jgi:hypothetical protein
MKLCKLTVILIILICVSNSFAQDRAFRINSDTNTKPGKAGEKWAMVVGINRYEDSVFQTLEYAVSDAKAVYNMLIDPSFCGYKKENVKLLTDEAIEPNLKPIRRNILRELYWLQMADQSDTVFIYLSGHGFEMDGKGYFVPGDTPLALLKFEAISFEDINQITACLNAKKVIFVVDACRSGMQARGGQFGDGFFNPLLTEAAGRVTLTSCGKDEFSYEWPEKRHGAFTYFFLEAIKGYADGNQDGKITITETMHYVQKNVRNWAIQNGKKQNPQFQMKDVFGDITLTTSTAEKLSVAFEKKEGKLNQSKEQVQLKEKLKITDAKPLRKEYGTLIINATPWSNVYLNDEKVGQTPLTFKVETGEHTLKMIHPDYPAVIKRIMIKPDRIERISIKMKS